MLTQEQQAAISGTGAYSPLPPIASQRPFPGEMGRPGSITPNAPVASSTGSMGMVGDFLLIALLGMLG